MKSRLRAAVWLALALCWPAHADFIEKKKYQEVVDPPTPVRGHAVVGIAVAPSVEDLKSGQVSVRIDPGLARDEIRVDVASANGRLRGEGIWEHVPGKGSADWFELSAPSGAARPDHVDQLALAAQPVSLSSEKIPTFQLVAWGRRKDSGASLPIRLYVNTRRAEMFSYGPGAPSGVRCTPVHGGPTVRFDAVCDMPLPLGPGRRATLTLVRRDGGQTSKQEVNLQW